MFTPYYREALEVAARVKKRLSVPVVMGGSRATPIGLTLGPLAETQGGGVLAISQGDPSVFVTQPISGAILLASAFLLVFPIAFTYIRRN